MWKRILFLKTNLLLLLFAHGVILFSCSKEQTAAPGTSNRVARVGDEILYEASLAKIENAKTKSDNLILRERFINNWIRKELLLQKAKLNLTEEEQNVENLVQKYRASLLINQYKQKYLEEHLDTIVTKEDVQNYVAEHSEDFVLKEPLYQYYLAKVASKNKRDVAFVRNLFSQKEVDLMRDFDLESSTVIVSNDNGWFTKKDLLKFLPDEVIGKNLSALKERKLFEIKSKNKEYFYFVLPLKILKRGEMSPEGYVGEKVKNIILHNRKLALAKQLEYEIYEDAKKKNEFEVY